jgi:hypothetical protein
MKYEVKGNINYSAQIVQIKKIIPIDNCDNIVSTTILGNNVIVSKDIKVGDIGIFFSIESKLSAEYLKGNNLYRDKTLNRDQSKSGFFELNGRIRCIKLRGNKSEGLFMPISSLSPLGLCDYKKDFKEYVGESFDYIDDIKICEKYITPNRQQSQQKNKSGRKAKASKIVPEQFHFHIDTEQLSRNLDKFKPDALIQISVKVHGTSAISSNILCNKKLNLFQKILLKLGVKLQTTEYENIYSSRKVIKNDDINKYSHFYHENIWEKGNDVLKEYLDKGMTIYYEIAGYLADNSYIQRGYDYGCEPGKFDIYIYRITHTNLDGKVFELSADQIQMWCKQRGLKPVVELFKGTVNEIHDLLWLKSHEKLNDRNKKYEVITFDIDSFLTLLKEEYLEKDCTICKNKVPFEGIVIRKLDTLDFEAYKLKSFRFLQRETEEIDEGQENIEDNQETINEQRRHY